MGRLSGVDRASKMFWDMPMQVRRKSWRRRMWLSRSGGCMKGLKPRIPLRGIYIVSVLICFHGIGGD